MRNLLARCAVVGVIVGGFVFTGDVARLTDRGMRLLNARTVPSEGDEARAEAATSQPSFEGLSAGMPVEHGVHVPEPSQPAGPQDVPHDAPLGMPTDAAPPSDGGLSAVQLASLQPGDRVSVWLSRPASFPSDGAGRTQMIAFDIVDPVSGEALEQRHIASIGGRRPTTTALGSPRRVVIAGSGPHAASDHGRPSAVTPGRIAKGETILYTQRSVFHGSETPSAPETFGPVLAVQVTRAHTSEPLSAAR